MPTTLRPVPAAPRPSPSAPRSPRAVPRARPGRVTRERAVRERAAAGTARGAGLALVGGLALSVPAVGLLDAAAVGGSTLDVAASLLVVAALDLVVGRGLYVVAGGRVLPAAYAALLSRIGHGLVLAVAAGMLIVRGAPGVPAFRDDWSTASLVLAAHLLVAGVALWRSRIAPRGVALAVSAGGAASLTLAALPGGAPGLLTVLTPVLAADAVLAGALILHGLRPARWRSWAARRPVATGSTSVAGH
jgi:hypothetical protein